MGLCVDFVLFCASVRRSAWGLCNGEKGVYNPLAPARLLQTEAVEIGLVGKKGLPMFEEFKEHCASARADGDRVPAPADFATWRAQCAAEAAALVGLPVTARDPDLDLAAALAAAQVALADEIEAELKRAADDHMLARVAILRSIPGRCDLIARQHKARAGRS